MNSQLILFPFLYSRLPICCLISRSRECVCTFGYQYVYLHYNVGIQVVVEFPIYFHSWIPGVPICCLISQSWDMCAPLVQVVVEFPIYIHSWIPGYQYAVLFHNLGNLCAPLVTNMGIYITMLGSRLWLNSQFISILGLQATNMLFYFTILGYVCTFGYQCVCTLQCWDPGCS